MVRFEFSRSSTSSISSHQPRRPHNQKLTFYYPSSNFTSFSVTGSSCVRNCAHCGGHYLKGMTPVSSGDELFEKCHQFYKNGGKGALVSGGCDASGNIDFAPFMKALRSITEFEGFRLNIHTGFLDRDGARELATIPFDSLSMDVVGSEETLRRVYGLERSLDSYNEVFSVFKEHRTVVSPHICIGLDFGKIEGEHRAIELVARHVAIVNKLIFIILIPTPGTEMEDIMPPSPGEIVDLVSYARTKLDNEIILGCMRPRDLELELALVRAGVDGVVNPMASTKKAMVKLAEEGALELVEEEGCCSF